MKSIFRATAILSGSSIVSIILGMVSAKVLALYLQPAGYGFYGLLQSFVGLTTLIAGLGMATGLVRLGAAAAKRNDEQAIANLRRGAWLLFGALGTVAMALLLIFREGLSRWALGSPDHGWTIVAMGVALLFTIAGNVQIGILNAYHRVTALAKYGIINTLLTSLIVISAVILWQTRGVVPAIITGAVLAFCASRYFIHQELGAVKVKATQSEAVKSAWELLRFGAPFTASSLVGAGVQLALPMVVVHLLNPESVGYYKAATAISVGYLGFLVTAMGQDYYPRLSAVADKPKELIKLINEQHRLVMLLGVPMILGMLALLPIFIPLVYSKKFTPTVEILEWQLIGDLFKFSSWTMSFAILARCKSSVYFVMEAIGGTATVVCTWLAVRWLGLPGLGVGFLGSYFVYYLAVYVTIRREIPLVWTPRNKQMMLGALAAALVVRLMPATRFAAYRTPVALAFAFAVGIPSLFVIWREFMASKEPDVAPAPKREQEEIAVKV